MIAVAASAAVLWLVPLVAGLGEPARDVLVFAVVFAPAAGLAYLPPKVARRLVHLSCVATAGASAYAFVQGQIAGPWNRYVNLQVAVATAWLTFWAWVGYSVSRRCSEPRRGGPLPPGVAPIACILLSLTTADGRAAPADDDWPQTRAERTDYRETSSLADVAEFLERLKAKGAPVTTRAIGQSAGGRPLVLAVAARPGVSQAAEARKAGKVVVYIQANIHGGEVEGKEAAQMLLRDVAAGRDGAGALLDKLVLLVVPVYNVDGNEALGDGARLRPSQDGPDRVGQRPNAAGLDLNRDAVKAEAPETRAALEHVYRAWDPDVMLDLHTTNGTRHGYLLTYSPPLNPDTEPGVLSYARDVLLPSARDRLKRERGWALFDYGNTETHDGTRGWYTFGQEGRYVTNGVGLRNRVAVLSEAASFQPFRVRVETTLAFVRAVLDRVAGEADRVRTLIRAADEAVTAWGRDPSKAPALGVRFEFAARGTEPVPLEVVPAGTRVDRRKAPDPSTLKPTPLPVFDRFRPTRTAPFPAAYLLPETLADAVALLRRDGVAVARLKEPWRGRAEVFRISERVTARQPFQGGRLTRLEGKFESRDAEAPAGSYLVRTSQPLGILAFHLLEPEGLDGAVAWGFLDGVLPDPPADYPVLKVPAPVAVVAEDVP
jgi:hypothetical protein